MSVRSDKNKEATPDAAQLLTDAASQEAGLGEGNSFCVASPDNPLKRQLVVSIRASLNDLCLQKSKGTWSPSSEALKSICKFPPLPRNTTSCETLTLPCLLSQFSRRSSPHSMYAAAHPLISSSKESATRCTCTPPMRSTLLVAAWYACLQAYLLFPGGSAMIFARLFAAHVSRFASDTHSLPCMLHRALYPSSDWR